MSISSKFTFFNIVTRTLLVYSTMRIFIVINSFLLLLFFILLDSCGAHLRVFIPVLPFLKASFLFHKNSQPQSQVDPPHSFPPFYLCRPDLSHRNYFYSLFDTLKRSQQFPPQTQKHTRTHTHTCPHTHTHSHKHKHPSYNYQKSIM